MNNPSSTSWPIRPLVVNPAVLGVAVIILLAIVEKWAFYFGFNLRFYEVALILLTPFAIYHIALRISQCSLPKALLMLIALKLFFFCLLLVSIIPILAAPVADESLGFFAKGVLQTGVRTAFFILLILLLVCFSESQRRRLFGIHLLAVSMSACYGLAQGAVLYWRGVDLDLQISQRFQSFTGREGPDLARYAYGSFYRLNGLAGDPNLQAAYAITAVPLIVALFLARPRWYLAVLLGIHACMIGLTMSLSGIAGLVVSLGLVLIFRCQRIKLMHLAYGGALLALAVFTFGVFREQIIHLVTVRTDPSGTTSQHADIALESLRIYRQFPFGVGYNNFSLAWRALSTLYPDRAMNPHNTYLAILVESGPLALICELITYGFIAVHALRRGTAWSKVFVASLVGMCVAALAYETLEMFYAQLFIVMGFTSVMLGDQLWLKKQPRPDTAPRATSSASRQAGSIA